MELLPFLPNCADGMHASIKCTTSLRVNACSVTHFSAFSSTESRVYEGELLVGSSFDALAGEAYGGKRVY